MAVLGIVLLCIVVLALLLGFYYSLVDTLHPEKMETHDITHITTGDIWRLRMCRYRKGRTTGDPVLLVHGASSNQHNFTTPPGESLVDHLVSRGYDCWTIDLRGTKSSQPPFERSKRSADLDGMLLYDLPAAIQHIRRCTGYAQVHWVGHSLGGMLLYAYALEHGEEHLASGVTLGSPVGFEDLKLHVPGLLLFLVRKFPHACGAFIRGNIPLYLMLRSPSRFFPTNVQNLHPAVNTSMLVNLIEDPLPRVTETLAQWARQGEWHMLGGELDVQEGLRELTVPLQLFFAPRDRFVPLDKAQQFFDALPSEDKAMSVLSRENGCEEDYDHCDLAFGKHGQHEIYEHIAQWFDRHPIRERLTLEQMGGKESDFVAPLEPRQRQEILSGNSYAHLAEGQHLPDAPVTLVSYEEEEPILALAESIEEAGHAPAIEIERIHDAEPTPPQVAPAAPVRRAPRKVVHAKEGEPAKGRRPAALKPGLVAATKTPARRGSKAKAASAEKPSKPSSKPKAGPKSAAKAAAKPAAKSASRAANKPAAAPKATEKPASRAKTPSKATKPTKMAPKATASPARKKAVVKSSAAEEATEVPVRTRAALDSAAAQLRELDKPKRK